MHVFAGNEIDWDDVHQRWAGRSVYVASWHSCRQAERSAGSFSRLLMSWKRMSQNPGSTRRKSDHPFLPSRKRTRIWIFSLWNSFCFKRRVKVLISTSILPPLKMGKKRTPEIQCDTPLVCSTRCASQFVWHRRLLYYQAIRMGYCTSSLHDALPIWTFANMTFFSFLCPTLVQGAPRRTCGSGRGCSCAQIRTRIGSCGRQTTHADTRSGGGRDQGCQSLRQTWSSA